MALHGRIAINDHTLAVWQARRLEKLTTRYDKHDYEWSVEVDNGAVMRKATGVLTHRYSDGCVTLASRVLLAAAEKGVGVL